MNPQETIDTLWNCHVTPYSPVPFYHVEAEQCKVLVRNARKLKWQAINTLHCLYSLPYKFIYQIEVPINLLEHQQHVSLQLIRELDSVVIFNGIHFTLNSFFKKGPNLVTGIYCALYNSKFCTQEICIQSCHCKYRK